MKNNSFTGYFILILLILCIIVTPFASHPKREKVVSVDTAAEDTVKLCSVQATFPENCKEQTVYYSM